MQPKIGRRVGLFSLIALSIFLMDQISKWVIAIQVMNPPRQIEITPFFNLVMAWNRGVSFSLFEADSRLQVWILVAFALAVVVFLLTWLIRSKGPLLLWAIGLIIGGAFGNIIDRLRFGAVLDFLDFHAFGWHWPAFNVGDSAICTGVALILFDNLMRKNHEK